MEPVRVLFSTDKANSGRNRARSHITTPFTTSQGLRTGMEQMMGKLGLGVRNDNGERLCEACEMNGYAIIGRSFSIKISTRLDGSSPMRRRNTRSTMCY